ncbi:MAG: hypothetical protein IIY55_09565 [Blautia sp.]|nr:hypothetical protein [Blautia sp.]
MDPYNFCIIMMGGGNIDTTQMIVTAVVMAVVLILLPLVIARKTGKSYREILLGSRGASGNGKKEGEKEEDKDKKRPAAGKEKNSNRNDLLDFVSSLVSYSRKHHFHLVFPGTVSTEEGTAMLTAILITRKQAVGFSCYGYGGTVLAKAGAEEWTQTLNGERSRFKSPEKKNARQEALLRAALDQAGYPFVPCEVMGVFTAKKLELLNAGKMNCFVKANAMEHLKEEKYLADGPQKPEEVGKALEKLVIKEQKQ